MASPVQIELWSAEKVAAQVSVGMAPNGLKYATWGETRISESDLERLVEDRFGLAFEFFINIGHNFVEAAGVPESFAALAWSQAEAGVRGETSQDAWETRRRAQEIRLGQKSPQIFDERSRSSFFESAFSDTLAVYMLSLAVDFDYHDLREREYPLLAAPALAERLRHVTGLFPPNAGYDFQILYRRKG